MTVHATAENLAGHYQEAASKLGDHAIEQQLLHDLKAAEEKYLLYLNKREEAVNWRCTGSGCIQRNHRRAADSSALPELSGLSFDSLTGAPAR